MAITQLAKENILDIHRSWKDVLGIANVDDVNPWRSRRIQNFLTKTDPDPGKIRQLDLATLLILLKHRNCIIDIPDYDNTTVKKTRLNQIKIGTQTRGKIIALKSNKETFNFSVTILDEKYLEINTKGGKDLEFAPRTYTITDYKGDFHNNWDKFVFTITDKEKEYFANCMVSDGNIKCDTFVSPSMAQTMYTEYYYLMKLLIDRLSTERQYLRKLRSEYITKLPKTKSDIITESVASDTIVDEQSKKKDFESKVIKSFECKISVPSVFHFDYINTEKLNARQIVDLCDHYLEGIVGVTDEYRFACRLVEFAFTKMNPYREDLKPTDLQTYNRFDCMWNEQKVKLPRSRIEWFELCFKKYSLLCRYYDKTIQIKK